MQINGNSGLSGGSKVLILAQLVMCKLSQGRMQG